MLVKGFEQCLPSIFKVESALVCAKEEKRTLRGKEGGGQLSRDALCLLVPTIPLAQKSFSTNL